MLSLAIKNIVQRKSRTFLAGVTVVIAIGSLTVFLALSNGVKQATFAEMQESTPLTQIVVLPNIEDRGLLSFITQSDKSNITNETIEKISTINGIKEVYPEIQLKNFASLETSVLSLNLMTDSMVFGVKKQFIENELENPDIWDQKIEPYPVIIPKKILDIYNFTIAIPQGLPTLTQDYLIGKEIILYPGYSMFFPQISKKNERIKLQIAGFSNKVNIIGISLPYDIVEEMNKKYSTSKKEIYTELFVETENASLTKQVADEIEILGFDTQYYQKNIKDVEAKLNYLSLTIGFISGVILLCSALAIIGIFLSITIERKKEIGLLRALGARKNQIKILILSEAAIIGLIGSLIGILMGVLISYILDRLAIEKLSGTTFVPEKLFLIDWQLILTVLIVGIFFSMLSAFIPAQKAANIDPIEALKK